MAGSDDEFLWEFLVESYENLDTIDSKLVGLETREDPDDIAAIFRSMHTIKGTSGFFGFSLVERLGHVSENLLGRIRDGQLRLTAERASALLMATDGLRGLFAGIEATGTEPPRDIEPMVRRLEALTVGETFEEPAGAAPADAAPAEAPAEPAVVAEAAPVAPAEPAAAEPAVAAAPAERRKSSRRKAAAPAPVAKERRTKARRLADQVPAVAALEQTMAAAPAEPAVEAPEAEVADAEMAEADVLVAVGSVASATGAGAPPALDAPPPPALAGPVSGGGEPPARPAEVHPPHLPTGGTEEHLLGQLLVAANALNPDDLALGLHQQGEGDRRPIGEILVANNWVDRPAVDAPLAMQRKLRNQAEPRHSAEDSTIRLDVSVLDELMNLVGELVLARNSLVRSISKIDDRSLIADAQRIDLVTSELQGRVLRTRMRPVRTVWAKLPRLVREVSMSCGRSVVLEVEGEETELDKSVVEAIKDPMTHCVRNAVDHGIEPPDVRVALGKSREGHLRLKASHENGQVVIVVSDDGRGIDPDKIRAKAVEKGIHTEDSANRLTDREVLDLIFAPGFSTAEKVTEVSGRGVGMDVVRTNVERIGGTVSVSSVLGQGTTFTFTIPLTLAIIPALLVSIGAHRYAIPQTSLVELVRLTGDDTENLIEDMHGLAVYRLRGKLLPIVDAAGVLQVQKKAARVGRKRLQLAVLQADGRSYGLVVDEVHGTEEIVVKPIGGHYGGIGCFAGATILGDGIVALILDVVGFANRAGVDESRIAEAALSGTVEAVAEHADRTQFVIVSDADQRRFAIPLTAWRGSRSSTARRSRRWPAAGSCSTATGSCHSPRSAAGRTTRTGRWSPPCCRPPMASWGSWSTVCSTSLTAAPPTAVV